MKKLLATLLALTMLVTVAFAAEYTPGKTIDVTGTETAWDVALAKELNSTNYYLSSASWTKGKDMVASVKLLSEDDEGGIAINLKQDYANDEDKALEGVITIREKGSVNVCKLDVKTTVGYASEKIVIDFGGDVDNIFPNENTVYTVEKTEGGKSYGVMTMESNGIEVAVRVYDGESFYLASDTTPDKDILLANADSDADPAFVNFVAAPTFSSTATLTFFDLDKDSVIYELKDGKLIKTAAAWDADKEVWTLKAKTLGNYVISDMELKSASGTTNNSGSSSGSDTNANPDTGSNDIVGIASALALAAIVSAAAISLKK